MVYPSRLLRQDEQIVINVRPHGKALVRPVLVLLVTMGVTGYAAARIPTGTYQDAARLAVVALAILVLVLFSLRPFLRWRTTYFVVTDRRVLTRSGVLARRGRDLPLSRVTDVAFSRGLLERLIGSGTLVVESAGEHGPVTVAGVPGVERVHRTLSDLVERSGGSS